MSIFADTICFDTIAVFTLEMESDMGLQIHTRILQHLILA